MIPYRAESVHVLEPMSSATKESSSPIDTLLLEKKRSNTRPLRKQNDQQEP